MNKETLYRNLRLLGTICVIILAILGAFGIDVPSIQDMLPASFGAAAVGVISAITNHWYNNNYTIGAKMAQPSIKEYNSAIKNEVDEMGRGEEHE